MDFGSKFVFNYSDSDEEVVSEDELEEGLNEETHGRDIIEDEAEDHMSSDDGFVNRPLPPPPPPMMGGGPPPPPPVGMFGIGKKSKVQKQKRKVHHWLKRDVSAAPKEEVKGKKWRRADTNVLSVKFGCLTSASNMHTGDPVYCTGCGAILSSISKLVEEGDDKIWQCEYCSERNIVDVMEEEIPQKTDVTFMLKPAPTTTASGRSGLDESLVVFCIDVSGSMCVTTEVPGKVKLRGDRLDRLQSLNTERESQYLPGQKKNITFVSRLQGVQAAVDFQLAEMAKEHPNRRICLVTFNNEVTMVGDGSQSPAIFSGDKLKNFEDMKKAGEELAVPQPVRSTRKSLGDKVFDLEEGGQTALGPALLLSVSMAAQLPGSKVIICTDGMANIGLGSLDNINNEHDFEHASTFYQDVSQFASDKGVSVSVITIKGTDCKLSELGEVADATGGQVNIVDPLKLTEEFGNILADSTIATNVQASLVLHKGLYFRNEESDTSKVTRQIGNVTKDTEITFEYGIRRQHKKPKRAENVYHAEPSSQQAATTLTTDTTMTTDETSAASSSGASDKDVPTIDDLNELPFQLSIAYTDLDGGQAVRVLTQTKPITKDRVEAEREMNPLLLGVHGAKQSADMALGGAYTNSRLNAFAYQRLMYRNMDAHAGADDIYDCYLDNVAPVERATRSAQMSEFRSKGHTHSDSEEDDDLDDECDLAGAPESARRGKGIVSKAASYLGFGKGKQAAKPKKAFVNRRMECSDDAANHFYGAKKASSSSSAWSKKK